MPLAVKMLGYPRRTPYKRTLFITGGLYLALDITHTDLSFRRTFGDFTSGFSHQFGVALSIMSMSQAYGIGWDMLNPVSLGSRKEMDYIADIPGTGNSLRLEAKGTSSDESFKSARTGAYRKKLVAPKNLISSKRRFKKPTAMVGVIVKAARDKIDNGLMEIIDPPEESNDEAVSTRYQLAARYHHYSGVAEFAGLHSIALEMRRRASLSLLEIPIRPIVMQMCGVAIFELLESIIYKPSSTHLHHYNPALCDCAL